MLEQFPELQRYLGLSLSTEQSTIVHSSVFESAVTKKCNGQSLNKDEQLFMDRFEVTVEVQPSELSFVERTLLATRIVRAIKNGYLVQAISQNAGLVLCVTYSMIPENEQTH